MSKHEGELSDIILWLLNRAKGKATCRLCPQYTSLAMVITYFKNVFLGCIDNTRLPKLICSLKMSSFLLILFQKKKNEACHSGDILCLWNVSSPYISGKETSRHTIVWYNVIINTSAVKCFNVIPTENKFPGDVTWKMYMKQNFSRIFCSLYQFK
jgi:hypothetical protein